MKGEVLNHQKRFAPQIANQNRLKHMRILLELYPLYPFGLGEKYEYYFRNFGFWSQPNRITEYKTFTVW